MEKYFLMFLKTLKKTDGSLSQSFIIIKGCKFLEKQPFLKAYRQRSKFFA